MEEHGGCAECTYVASGAFIRVSPEVRQQVEITPTRSLRIALHSDSREDFIVALGRFTSKSWSGHAVWYAFQCMACGEVSRDYSHGSHLLHLDCQNEGCGAQIPLYQRRFYIDVGLPEEALPPLSLWERIFKKKVVS